MNHSAFSSYASVYSGFASRSFLLLASIYFNGDAFVSSPVIGDWYASGTSSIFSGSGSNLSMSR